MKQIKQKLIVCMLFSMGSVQEVTPSQSMPTLLAGANYILPYLLMPSTSNITQFDLSLLLSSGASVYAPSLSLQSKPFWLLFKNFNVSGFVNNGYQLNFTYSSFDWKGNIIQAASNLQGGNSGSGPAGPSSMSFSLLNNGNTWLEVSDLPYIASGGLAVFIMTMANANTNSWPVAVAQPGFITKIPSDLSKKVGGNISVTPMVAGIPLNKTELQEDLQIMLIAQTNAYNSGCTNTIVCSLVGSMGFVNSGNLTNGVYIVLDKPLPIAQGASMPAGSKYSVYSRSGKLLGSSTISSIGSNEYQSTGSNGMLLFSSAIAKSSMRNSADVYPLRIGASINPQVFLLQIASGPITSLLPSAPAKGTTPASGTQTVATLIQSIATDAAPLSGFITSFNSTSLTFPPYVTNLVAGQSALIGDLLKLVNVLSPADAEQITQQITTAKAQLVNNQLQ